MTNGVSLSEAERRMRQAPSFDAAAFLAVVERTIGASRDVSLEQRYRLASLLLAAANRPTAHTAVLRRARELVLLSAIDLLTERHDGVVFERAEAVAASLVEQASPDDPAALILAGRLYLDPFAPDPAYDLPELGLAFRTSRQKWFGGLASGALRSMPERDHALTVAAGHFRRAAEQTAGPARGVALTHMAFVSFTRMLLGEPAAPESYRGPVAEAAGLLPPGHDPPAHARLLWMMGHGAEPIGDGGQAVLWPMQQCAAQFGLHAAAGSYVCAIRRALPVLDSVTLSVLTREVLSALPERGCEATRMWLLMQQGHHLPGDPSGCRDHVPGQPESPAPERFGEPATRVHALYHRTHYAYEHFAPVDSLLRGAPEHLVSPYLLIRAVSALNSAARSFDVARVRSAMEFAMAAVDFTVLGYREQALNCLEMMTDQLEGEEEASVGFYLGRGLELIVRLADVTFALHDEAASQALQECLAVLIRGAAACGTAESVAHLFVLSQLVKAQTFGGAVGLPKPLRPTEEQRRVLRMVVEEEAAVTGVEASVTPDDSVIDFFGFGLVSFLSRAETVTGSTPADVIRNLRVEYQQATGRGLAASAAPAADVIPLDEMRASLPAGVVLVSLYYGVITRRHGYGLLAQIHTRDDMTVLGAYSPDGQWMERMALREGAGDEAGVGQRDFLGFSLKVGMLWRMLQEDPLHRKVARQAQERLADMALELKPLLRHLEGSTADGSRPHLCVWPHQATYFLPLWLLPFRDGILADYCTVTLMPSLRHLPGAGPGTCGGAGDDTPPVAPASGVLAVGSADGGARHGLQTEPSLEETAEAIGTLFGCTALTGDRATPEQVLRRARDAVFLHIAGHGGRDPVAPAFHCVYLHADPGGEGRLFAHQVSECDLRHVRLVTLSACESSMIRYDYNDNPVGLPAAFLLAGAAAVVGALWPVTAAVADAFFLTLYTRLANGDGTLNAFRTAQQETRGRFSQYRDWGAFCFLGRTEQED
ncbi:CHAT domain-containing protein [Streptomyces sp. NBC_00075]|uniref:CHAT domain-containing protein n=1 Tax=Streptomyces sp. NBC_00075 TaxID=2975641 RepID=UPI0032500CB2